MSLITKARFPAFEQLLRLPCKESKRVKNKCKLEDCQVYVRLDFGVGAPLERFLPEKLRKKFFKGKPIKMDEVFLEPRNRKE